MKNKIQVPKILPKHLIAFWWSLVAVQVSLLVWRHWFESGRVLKLFALGHFAWHRARQSTDTRAYILPRFEPLSIIFWTCSVAISRWYGLTLNMNIRFPLFWSTWTVALGPTFCLKNLKIEIRSSSSQCRSLLGIQTSHFICKWFGFNLW